MGRSRISPLGIGAAVVGLLALVGVALALALPIDETVTFTGGASIDGPSEVVVDVDCGTALRGGPDIVESGGEFRDDPCGETVRGRRLLAAGVGVVALVAIAVVVLDRRRVDHDHVDDHDHDHVDDEGVLR